MFNLLGVLVLIALNANVLIAEYPACGGTQEDVTEAGLEENINGQVTRLLALRKSDGSWTNTPEVALSIQLTRPDSFTDSEKSFNQMSDEVREDISSMSVGKLAQYTMAVKSACKNISNFGGVDLKSKLLRRLNEEFNYKDIQHSTPRNGWYNVFLAIQAYCVTQKQSPGDEYIHRVLHAQNRDGSFDNTGSIDHTSHAMLALLCLYRINSIPSSQANKVETSLNRATIYIESKVTIERNRVWLGDKYSSPQGVLAINEYSGWTVNAWRCSLILRSLNQPHTAIEGESALAQRLLALKGVTSLTLLDENYNCVTPESNEEIIDSDNTVRESSTLNCDREENVETNFPFLSLSIDVDIIIQPFIATDDVIGRLEVKSITLREVGKGKTLLQLLKTAQCRGLLTFETQTTAWGEYITTIDSKTANSENNEYWSIERNGQSLSVGVGQYIPYNSDIISFRLKKWS